LRSEKFKFNFRVADDRPIGPFVTVYLVPSLLQNFEGSLLKRALRDGEPYRCHGVEYLQQLAFRVLGLKLG